MNKEQEQFIRELIEKNIGKLVEAYQSAYYTASYQPQQVAVNNTYCVLNRLIPDNFRENISIKDCQILNSQISAMANKAVQKYIDNS